MPSLIQIKNDGQDPFQRLNFYIKKLHEHTGRNVIVYYSGWLSFDNAKNIINDLDMNGFMAMTHDIDYKQGADLILHTPGGVTSATESVIKYIQKRFNKNVRAIVPQLAMSGGTMMACSCKEIIMGKQSSLGPIDPQVNGVPAQAILTEFLNAKKEIDENPSTIPLWQTIISKYDPTFIDSCQKSIELSNIILKESLQQNMFKNEDKEDIIENIVDILGSRKETKIHDRHIPLEWCKEMGLKVSALEDDNDLQDYVLSVHHSCMEIFELGTVYKIFANQKNNLFYG